VSPTSVERSVLSVLVSFVLAVLSWRYVERPFRERQLLPDAKSLFTGAALASAATVGLGLLLYFGGGLPRRHSAEVLALGPNVAERQPSRPEGHMVTPHPGGANRLFIRGSPGSPPSFILVGDSHAYALSDGLFAAARNRGVAGVQFTAADFAPLPGRSSLDGSMK